MTLASFRLTLGAVVLIAVGAACSVPNGEVSMTAERVFAPETVTISAGDSVTWVNTGADAHTVTAEADSIPEGADYFASGGFETESDALDDVARGLLGAEETYSVTLTEPGTYRYFCIPHRSEGMVGTVIVE